MVKGWMSVPLLGLALTARRAPYNLFYVTETVVDFVLENRTNSSINFNVPEEAFFLGTTLKMGNGGNAKVTLQTTHTGKTFKRRSTGWETVMNAPLLKLLKKLNDRADSSKHYSIHSRSKR